MSDKSKSWMAVAVGALSLTLTLGAPAAHAATKPNTGGAAVTQTLLKRYEALQSYQGTVQSITTLQPTNGSKPNVIRSTMNVEYKKPNFLHVTTDGLMGGGTMISNGATVYTYSALTNQYSERPAPHSLLSAFLTPLKKTNGLHVTGHSVIDGVPVTEYVGAGAGASQYQLYVANASGLIRRLVVHLSQLPGAQGGRFHMTLQQDYVDQKLNQQIPAALFQFSPPSGAQKGPSGTTMSIMGGLGS